MKLSRAVHEWVLELRLTKSPLTVAGYESDLHRLVALAQQDTILYLNPDLIHRYFVMLSSGGAKPSTLHRKRAAISEFCKWGIRKRLWVDNPLTDFPRIRKPKLLPRPYTADEVTALLAVPLPPMERVLRALLLFTGLRITPICALKVGDVSRDPAAIRAWVKGAKTQVIQLHPDLAELLVSYILSHTNLTTQAPLLAQKNGKPLNRKLADRICGRWGKAAGVVGCIPHRFRHTFATSLLQAGVNIRLIQEALGHEDLGSTMRYTEVTALDLSTAVKMLPWKP